ncbi:hypothetical protein ACLKA7_009055 [Drosophila subpalustris]
MLPLNPVCWDGGWQVASDERRGLLVAILHWQGKLATLVLGLLGLLCQCHCHNCVGVTLSFLLGPSTHVAFGRLSLYLAAHNHVVISTCPRLSEPIKEQRQVTWLQILMDAGFSL